MRAKILSSTSTFNGVSYNTHKTHNSKGELMKIKNFGYLQSATGITPDEIKSYLKAYSKRNSRVKDKQFHAMISCKGREFDKEKLTKIAEELLQKMGYGENPYLVVFHSDTENNHVHMVSTRIGRNGKKINDSMEKIKAQASINEIMKKDPKINCGQMISNLESFSYSTANQAKLYFETSGYRLKEDNGLLKLYKYGLLQGEVPLVQIKDQVKMYSPNKPRVRQLQALLEKYNQIYDCTPIAVFEPLKGNRVGKQTGYRSELSDFLRLKFGIEMIFHGKEGKDPYGYSIIDHKGKSIFKGSEIISLKELLRKKSKSAVSTIKISQESEKDAYAKIFGEKQTGFHLQILSNKEEYRLKLLSILEEYPTISEGLERFKLKILKQGKSLYLMDYQRNFFVGLNSILDAKEQQRFASFLNLDFTFEPRDLPNTPHIGTSFNHAIDRENNSTIIEAHIDLWNEESDYENISAGLALSISQDVDDEKTHGNERRKDRKSNRKLKRN